MIDRQGWRGRPAHPAHDRFLLGFSDQSGFSHRPDEIRPGYEDYDRIRARYGQDTADVNCVAAADSHLTAPLVYAFCHHPVPCACGVQTLVKLSNNAPSMSVCRSDHLTRALRFNVLRCGGRAATLRSTPPIKLPSPLSRGEKPHSQSQLPYFQKAHEVLLRMQCEMH